MVAGGMFIKGAPGIMPFGTRDDKLLAFVVRTELICCRLA